MSCGLALTVPLCGKTLVPLSALGRQRIVVLPRGYFRHARLLIWKSLKRSISLFHLVIQSAGRLFDALGVSATQVPSAVDRFWRNARTLATHNPLIYKTRIASDFAANGTPAPDQWTIGVAASTLNRATAGDLA